MKKILIFSLAITFAFGIILTPNVLEIGFSQANAEEEIPVSLKLNQKSYKFGEPIILQVNVGKFVPNTEISTYTGEENFWWTENLMKISKNSSYVLFLPNHELGYVPSGTYKIDVFYGDKDNYLGKNSISFDYIAEINPTAEFISKNYFLDKFDIGTDYKIRSPYSSKLNLHTCVVTDLSLCPVNLEQVINDISVSLSVFKNKSSAEKAFNISPNLENGWLWYDFGSEYLPHDNDYLKTPKNFHCKAEINDDQGNFFINSQKCLKDNLIVNVITWEYGDPISLSNQEYAYLLPTVAEKINSSPFNSTNQKQPTSNDSKKIASFVDPKKDPQSYVKRYQSEPAYKTWFDTNYPQYNSIEEAVGLKLTEKIPNWVKNIFGWYAQDQVSEDELLNAIKYLINEKILNVN